MPTGLRWFADRQPFTPMIETVRGLLMGTHIGHSAIVAVAWCAAIGAFGYVRERASYDRRPVRLPDAAIGRDLGDSGEFVGCVMAYDEEMADRIRELLALDRDVTEKRMFGGLAFLVGGNMAVTASRNGGIMVRVDPAESDKIVESTPAEFMIMRGRQMAGWLQLRSDDVRTKRELSKWVGRGVGYARSLPPKRGSR